MPHSSEATSTGGTRVGLAAANMSNARKVIACNERNIMKTNVKERLRSKQGNKKAGEWTTRSAKSVGKKISLLPLHIYNFDVGGQMHSTNSNERFEGAQESIAEFRI